LRHNRERIVIPQGGQDPPEDFYILPQIFRISRGLLGFDVRRNIFGLRCNTILLLRSIVDYGAAVEISQLVHKRDIPDECIFYFLLRISKTICTARLIAGVLI
jgi:hypothetical protein